MTDLQLKQLKDRLWHSADVLRAGAHLAANKYGQPILGLIFLRYADILFKQHKSEIETEYNKLKGTRMEKTIKEISIEKCGFYLPECAYYDFINDAPDDANKATLVKKAMEQIEDENPKMSGVLPKEVYAQLVPEEEPELLSNIVRIFKDIPENCTRTKFSERYKRIIDSYNAGGTENEEYYEQLVKLIEDMKKENERADVEGLTEEELEIFDLLIAGKKLTKAEEQKVKLSAKNLFKKLSEHKSGLLVVDWYKDEQPFAKVKSAVEISLNEDLPDSYDRISFTSKIDLLMNHFVDMAVQGYGWIGEVA